MKIRFVAVIISTACASQMLGQATSSKLTREALQKVEVGMPRKTVEESIGLPLRERTIEASQEEACPFKLTYCRYTVWQRQEPVEFRREREAAGEERDDADNVNWGDGYAVVDVQIFYNKQTDAVVLFAVHALPSVLKYSFPGGILGVTSFDSLKSPAGESEAFDGYKTSQWWTERHRLGKERYYLLVGSPKYTKPDKEVYNLDTESEPVDRRSEFIDRKRTIIDRVLVMGNKGQECSDSFLKDTASTPGWVSDRNED